MKHKFLALLTIQGILLFATGCNNTVITSTIGNYGSTPNMIEINSAYGYSYVVDGDTSVVYIYRASPGGHTGLTPKLHPDGTPYLADELGLKY